MNHKLIYLIGLTALFFAGCAKSLDQSRQDLKSAEAKTRQAAIERLGRDGAPMAAQLAADLATTDIQERNALFAVLTRLGEPAVPFMIDKVGLVFTDRETRESFTNYFRSLGDKGPAALLKNLMETAAKETQQMGAKGSPDELSKLHHQFESLSLILETLNNSLEVNGVPELLRHPYDQVRVRAAYLLCIKNWKPKDPAQAIIYFTHLSATLKCPNAADPLDEAARRAAENWRLYLETEANFPVDQETNYKIMAAAGTPEIANYIYKQAVGTANEFMLLTYFQTLKAMESDIGQRLARQLWQNPQKKASLLALDPNAGQGM